MNKPLKFNLLLIVSCRQANSIKKFPLRKNEAIVVYVVNNMNIIGDKI